jgi:UDP-glucose 4-epimerase
MTKILVTGCAGFIGSTLSERLINEKYEVIGIDCFRSNYDRKIKEKNLSWLLQQPRFSFLEQDLIHADLDSLLQRISYVFHLAALPGVRTSWGADFKAYIDNNIFVTQRLLEAAKKRTNIKKIVYSSSSSIYGGMEGPTSEDKLPYPISPYGVTKLSAEQLCQLYYQNFDLPVNSLRYFTVFGPRQRPDMAFHRMITNILKENAIPIFGDGKQSRDFTYVDDIVTANLLAAFSTWKGEIFNIGGISHLTVNEVIAMIEKQIGRHAQKKYLPPQAGDPKHTWANISKANERLSYQPIFDIEKGIFLQLRWIQQNI